MYESHDLAESNSFLPAVVLNFKWRQTHPIFPHIERADFLLKTATQGELTNPNKVNESNSQKKRATSCDYIYHTLCKINTIELCSTHSNL